MEVTSHAVVRAQSLGTTPLVSIICQHDSSFHSGVATSSAGGVEVTPVFRPNLASLSVFVASEDIFVETLTCARARAEETPVAVFRPELAFAVVASKNVAAAAVFALIATSLAEGSCTVSTDASVLAIASPVLLPSVSAIFIILAFIAAF
mmetsp:Transcript_13591/g.20467  ORF Transcript_13591/g.20467 Transcript_13591/m.20467 type:complete len:150 (+) Transcript_13591:321-770(+)